MDDNLLGFQLTFQRYGPNESQISLLQLSLNVLLEKYQPSSARGTSSPPATPYPLQNPKWPLGDHKMADRVWKGHFRKISF